MSPYAELAAATNFSFLRGASHPAEIVARAAELGLTAIGIADRNTLAGVVRAHQAAQEHGIRLLVGSRIVAEDGFEALVYPVDRAAYGRLCRLLSRGKLGRSRADRMGRSPGAACRIPFAALAAAAEGQVLIAVPPARLTAGFVERLGELAAAWPGQVFLAGVHRHRGDERRRLGRLAELGEACGAPLVAAGDVLYHAPERRPLQDVLTCIREGCRLDEAGRRLEPHAERHLKGPEEMARLFRDHPAALARTVEIAERCTFSLGELRYEYPDEPVPPGRTPQAYLEELAWRRARWRFPEGLPEKVERTLTDELALIAELDYARYFLTLHDVVEFARSRGILAQGRGSAANSVVCYCLGITAVDPTKVDLLFARFISRERDEPPDIDVDFEHERREEVIQYLYTRYGRERAAICATVIHYRPRMAIREVGKVLGLTPDVTAALAETVWGSWGDGLPDRNIAQAGLDPMNPAIRQAVDLANELVGFPRHLSQHVGGFVLTREQLDETVPIGPGAMPGRTFIEWDKDDIDAIGLMKVDVLALGMLSCIRRALRLLETHHGEAYPTLADLPPECPEVYRMLARADSVGVFQVESRAQMAMLPRLRPACFYDLVVEVAIVRPGPIQGDMVHPYLRRRELAEPVTYPAPHPAHGDKDELKDVLGRTYGVPLFQEQAMRIAIVAAGFTDQEADGLRRAMATFRHHGTIDLFERKFVGGMVRRGYERTFAESCFRQIRGFSTYGFPESHAASFALLVYVSAWIKCHRPDVFLCAILNSQPMGFYRPAQLVRDAIEHGVEVRPVDVNHSHWDCTLEPARASPHRFAVRLGLRQVSGLGEDAMERAIEARGNGFHSIERLARVEGMSRACLERLAEADAFRSLGLDRRAALWAVRGLDGGGLTRGSRRPDPAPLPLFASSLDDDLFREPEADLPRMPLPEHVAEDYISTGLSLRAHPCRFFRPWLGRLGASPNAALHEAAQGEGIAVAGLVLTRQKPGTAKGVVFLTLEDETGIANVVVWRRVFERHRATAMGARFLLVRGRVQRAGAVVHVLAERLADLSPELARLRGGFEADPAGARAASRAFRSRDFH